MVLYIWRKFEAKNPKIWRRKNPRVSDTGCICNSCNVYSWCCPFTTISHFSKITDLTLLHFQPLLSLFPSTIDVLKPLAFLAKKLKSTFSHCSPWFYISVSKGPLNLDLSIKYIYLEFNFFQLAFWGYLGIFKAGEVTIFAMRIWFISWFQ